MSVETLEPRDVPATANLLSVSSYTDAKPWGRIGSEFASIGFFTAPPVLSDVSTFQFTGDFNGDGTNDLATFMRETTWEVNLSQRDGFLSVTWANDWFNQNGWQHFSVGDFNKDGYADVLGIDWAGFWRVGLSNGFRFSSRMWGKGSSQYWSSIHVGDFTGEGRDDVMALDYVGKWRLFESTGSRFITSSTSVDWVSPKYFTTIQVGDFNGDGRDDIAGLRFKKTWIVILGGKTLKSATWATNWPTAQNWQSFVAADVDLDGDADVLGLTNNGVWYIGRAEASRFKVAGFSSAVKNLTQNWRSIQVADVTGDGRPDLVHWHINKSFYILVNNGKAAYRETWTVPYIPSNVQSMRVDDMNGDGLADVVMTTAGGALYTGLSAGNRFYFGLTSPAPFFFIAPWDLAAVRAKPTAIATIFPRYLPGLKRKLARIAPNMSEPMLALVFTSIFAYEHASYRAVGDPLPTPKAQNFSSLLASPKLVCTEYDYFAHHLYRLIFPKPKTDPMEISIIGWNKGIIGNHSQIVASDGKETWLLDPTVGLIARTDLASLLKGESVPSDAIVDFSRRVETSVYLEGVMTRFRTNIKYALTAGAFPLSTSLYERSIDSVLRYRYKP